MDLEKIVNELVEKRFEELVTKAVDGTLDRESYRWDGRVDFERILIDKVDAIMRKIVDEHAEEIRERALGAIKEIISGAQINLITEIVRKK